MIEYYFEVKHQYIEGPDNATFISGSAEIYSAVFHFDSTWDGFSKTAVFKCGEKRVEQLLVNDKCTIPQEMLDEAKKYFCVGVYGVNGSTRMPTVYSDNYFILPGAEPSETARNFSPDIFDQIVEIGQQAAGDATSANAAKNAALAALGEMHSCTASSSTLPSGSPATVEYNEKQFFFGIPQGEKGDKGDTGEAGPQGSAGKSAYESAQDGGYVGTEEQFNADLSMASSKQNATDSSLTTADKTVVGAINELEQGKVNSTQGVANARKTMKVDASGNIIPVGWRELASITTTEEKTYSVTFTADSDGNPFELDEFIVTQQLPTDMPSDDGSTTNVQYLSNQNTNISQVVGIGIGQKYRLAHGKIYAGILIVDWYANTVASSNATNISRTAFGYSLYSAVNLTSVSLANHPVTSAYWGPGTVIKLYAPAERKVSI